MIKIFDENGKTCLKINILNVWDKPTIKFLKQQENLKYNPNIKVIREHCPRILKENNIKIINLNGTYLIGHTVPFNGKVVSGISSRNFLQVDSANMQVRLNFQKWVPISP